MRWSPHSPGLIDKTSSPSVTGIGDEWTTPAGSPTSPPAPTLGRGHQRPPPGHIGGATGALIEGTLQDPSAVVLTGDTLSHDGTARGGVPEYIVPCWQDSGAITVDRVSGANPEF